MKILNMPEYAKQYGFIVARESEGRLHFYGAYSTFEKAQSVANEVYGIIVRQFLSEEG